MKIQLKEEDHAMRMSLVEKERVLLKNATDVEEVKRSMMEEIEVIRKSEEEKRSMLQSQLKMKMSAMETLHGDERNVMTEKIRQLESQISTLKLKDKIDGVEVCSWCCLVTYRSLGLSVKRKYTRNLKLLMNLSNLLLLYNKQLFNLLTRLQLLLLRF